MGGLSDTHPYLILVFIPTPSVTSHIDIALSCNSEDDESCVVLIPLGYCQAFAHHFEPLEYQFDILTEYLLQNQILWTWVGGVLSLTHPRH